MKGARTFFLLTLVISIASCHVFLSACSQTSGSQSTSFSLEESQRFGDNRGANDAVYGSEKHIKTGLAASNQWNLPEAKGTLEAEQERTFAMAERLRESGKSEMAIDNYKKLLAMIEFGNTQPGAAKNRLVIPAEMGLAKAYCDCRKTEEARNEVNKVLALDAQNKEARALINSLEPSRMEARSP